MVLSHHYLPFLALDAFLFYPATSLRTPAPYASARPQAVFHEAHPARPPSPQRCPPLPPRLRARGFAASPRAVALAARVARGGAPLRARRSPIATARQRSIAPSRGKSERAAGLRPGPGDAVPGRRSDPGTRGRTSPRPQLGLPRAGEARRLR